MSKFSTHQVAKMLGVDVSRLGRYIKDGRVPAPPWTLSGGHRMRLWSDKEIEQLRLILPTIKNGRKTRYEKLREQQKQSTQAGAPVPHKSRGAKKQKKR